MASLAELMVRVGADISEFSRQMQNVERTMKDTGKGLMNVGKSVGEAGSKMAKAVSLPVLGLATSAVVVGAQFDAQMSRVQAISGATQGQFEQLRKKALELGASTTFSSSEVAQAMEELASAGFDTGQILDATAGVLNLASSAGIGLAEASAIAGSAIQGFGLKASDASHVADVLAKAAAISATNATGLGEAFKYIAPVAHSMGLSIEEVAGAIGIMANAGIDGSQAGTTLRAGLLRLASPTKEMKDLMKETGANFFDANGKMKSLSGIIAELTKATAGMTDQQKANYLATLFGQEAVSGWMTLIDAGTGKLNKYTNELKNSDGAGQKMADTMNNNLAGAWNNLTGALESLAISFADVMKGGLQTLADKLSDLANWFQKLPTPIKQIIVVVGLLISAIAPLLIVIGFISQGLGALSIAFGAISAPVAIVVGAIIGLIAVFTLLWNKCQWFRDGVTSAFNTMKDLVQQAISAVVSFVQTKMTALTQFWNENGQQILQAIHNVWDFIAPIVEVAMKLVLFIIQTVWENIKGVISGALNIIMGIIQVFAGLFTGDFGKMWEGIKQLFLGAIEFIWNLISLMMIGRIVSAVGSFVKLIVTFFKDQWDNIRIIWMYGKDAVVNIVKGFINIVKNLWNGFKNAIVNVAKAIWDGVKSTFNTMKAGIESIWNGIKSVATAVWNAIKSGISGVVNGIKSVVEGAWNFIKSITSSIFNGVKSVVLSVWNGIKSTVTSVVNGIKSAVSSVWNGIKSITSSVFNSVKGVVTSIWNGIKSAITNPIKAAHDTIVGIVNKIKSVFSNLHLKIPKPSLPQVDISIGHKKIAGINVPYPKFSIHWNAKGAIFNQPTLLGGGQGVGEAGAEAVIPIQHKRYMAPFARAVAENLDAFKPSNEPVVVENVVYTTIELDGEVVGRKVEKYVSRQQLERTKRNNRGGR